MALYQWCTVEGVKCVEWKAKTYDNSSTSKAKQNKQNKKEKDKFGNDNREIPILDTRKSIAGMEYCNLIIYTEDINAWEQAIRGQYSAYEQHTEALQGGHQITIRRKDSGTLPIVVSVYPQNGKLMIQPGEEDEENLLEVLRGFPDLKRERQRNTSRPSICTNTLKASSTKDTTANMEGPDKKHGEKEGAGNELQETDSSAETADACSDNTLLECANNSITEITMGTKKLIVNLPPVNSVDYSNHSINHSDKAPEGYISMFVPRPPMPLSSDYHKKQFIVNEVLCYIQNKMNSEAKEVIVNLASQFFTYEEIIAAKKLLYEVAPVTRRRLIIHRGDDKARQEVADMYYHFHSVQLNDVPMFLALDISRLPPLTSNSNDMTTILKNIESMQLHIKTLTEVQKTMSEVMAAHICKGHTGISIHQKLMSSRETNDLEPREETYATQEASTTLESDDLESSLSEHSSISTDDDSEDEMNEDSRVQGAPTLNVAKASQTSSAYRKIKTRIFSSNNLRKQPVALTDGSFSSRNPVSDLSNAQSKQDSSNSYQGRQLNQNQKSQLAKDNIVRGTATAPGLRAINKQRQTVSTDADNRTCTGIFITRLRPHTTANDVETYLRQETGMSVKAEKLPTRYN